MADPACWCLERDEPAFPAVLASIPDPPKRLYGIGDPHLLTPGLGIVGSRRASTYGLACARRFAGVAARAGVVTVSGGARGCDAAAHGGALDAGGPTVAVLGCGPDVDYPPTESALLDRIRRTGCVISELDPGHPPMRWAFPRRNRLIAGLSAAVLVVEAGLPSGTFSTADHALDAGRDVLAVPGSIIAPGSRGTNRLISNGAGVITSDEDLLDAMGWTLRSTSARRSGQPRGHDGLSPDEREIVETLSAQPCGLDVLSQQLRSDVVALSRMVADLEAREVLALGLDGKYTVSERTIDGAL